MSDKQQPVQGAIVNLNQRLEKYLDIEDTYGARVVVSDSSAVSGDGTPFVWVRIDGGQITDNSGASHLTVLGAQRLRDALDAFLAGVDTDD